MSETKKTAKPAVKKTGSKARAAQLGSLVPAKNVVRPDGSEVTIEGGIFVLDVPGTFVVDGKKIEVE